MNKKEYWTGWLIAVIIVNIIMSINFNISLLEAVLFTLGGTWAGYIWWKPSNT